MTRAQADESSSRAGNSARGEASIHVSGRELVLRPTFDALCRAEDELGSLFALVERAAAGELRLSEIAALFWHCLASPGAVERTEIGEAVVEMGFTRASVPLKLLLGQVLRGR